MSKASATQTAATPVPVLDGLAGEFYSFLRQRELRFQRCADCQSWRHVPRYYCPNCASDRWTWERSSGRGVVYSWSTVHRPMHAAFTETPYAVVIVELEEGPRLLSELLDVPLDEYQLGVPVRVVFHDVTDELTLAKFERETDR